MLRKPLRTHSSQSMANYLGRLKAFIGMGIGGGFRRQHADSLQIVMDERKCDENSNKGSISKQI